MNSKLRKDETTIDAENEKLWKELTDRVAEIYMDYDGSLPIAVKRIYRSAMKSAMKSLSRASYGSVAVGKEFTYSCGHKIIQTGEPAFNCPKCGLGRIEQVK